MSHTLLGCIESADQMFTLARNFYLCCQILPQQKFERLQKNFVTWPLQVSFGLEQNVKSIFWKVSGSIFIDLENT